MENHNYANYKSERTTKSIVDFYEDKHVLITGSTGFMGKVLVEKILRSCPKVAAIYLLVRPKKGKESHERIEELTKIPLFDKIRTEKNSETLLSKLHAINADLLKANLDLSNDDLQLLQDKVNIVFHMAANVRFDQSLKSALYQNTGGTLAMLQLAESFKHLQAFVHVSTSYCHCDQKILEEKVYEVPHNPRKMLDLVSWLDEDLIKLLTPQLLQNAPNTYSYTKCLTEQLVTEYSKKIPASIARPSIVVGCQKEPIPGWIDNFNGPVGLLIGAGKGVIRSMHGNPNLTADLVPVDTTIRGLLLVSKETHERQLIDDHHPAPSTISSPQKEGPLVVNLTSGRDNQLTWGDLINISKRHFLDNPFSICLWYPGGSIKTNYFLHVICVFLFHVIPAYIVDFLMIMMRNKPFLVRTQKRIQGGLEILQYYTRRPWHFRNDKIKRLTANLNDEERKIFGVDYMEIDWEQYILNMVHGARLYCMKESPETLPQARRLLKKLYYLNLFKNIVLVILLGYFLWTFIPLVSEATSALLSL